jgi:hypothetical protein
MTLRFSKNSRGFLHFLSNGLLDEAELVAEIVMLSRRGALERALQLARMAVLYQPRHKIFNALLVIAFTDDGWLGAAEKVARWGVWLAPYAPDVVLSCIFVAEAQGRSVDADRMVDRLLEPRGQINLDRRTRQMVGYYFARNDQAEQAWRLHYEAARTGKDEVPKREERYREEANFTSRAENTQELMRFCLSDDFGQAIHAAQFLAPLKERYNVEIFVAERLRKLFVRSFPRWKIRALKESGSEIGDAAAIDPLAIPYLARSLTRQPNPSPLLKADPVRSSHIRRFLKQHFEGQILVGVGWRSRSRSNIASHLISDSERLWELDFERSKDFHPSRSIWRKVLPLRNLRGLVSHPRIAAISLQHDLTTGELSWIQQTENLPIEVTSIGLGGDLDDVAVLIDSLDAVVTISSTHGHLAAGLGKPTFVPVHGVPPLNSNWPGYEKFSYHQQLTIVSKRDEPGADGQFDVGYAGDWREPIAAVLKKILALELNQ